MAGFVRQFRTGLVEEWLLLPEKQVALGQVLWHVLGGGRPLRLAISPERSRRKALEKAEGLCAACGAPATTVDHIGSGCNRTSNLRAVCDDCCTDRPFADPRVLQQPGYSNMLTDIACRIQSSEPLRCCDDAGTWDWRTYLKLRMSG